MDSNAPEHLLLVTLGESPGVVLGLVDWLNNRAAWPSVLSAQLASISRITHLWLVTTSLKSIVANLDDGVVKPLGDPAFGPLDCRILVIRGVDDILTDRDHRTMAEAIFRLALQADEWRDAGQGRIFSAAVSGGRKTMSAAMQQAALFFEADHVLHLNYAGDDSLPDTLEDVRLQRRDLHPVSLSVAPSGWKYWLHELWASQRPNVRLCVDSFPLSDAWRPAAGPRLGPPIVVDSIYGSGGKYEGLEEGLDLIAADSQAFARNVLACGIGASFLRHDLRRLVSRLASNPATESHPRDSEATTQSELGVLDDYLDGLAQVTDRTFVRKAGRVPVMDAAARKKDLVQLCGDALVLAVGKRVPLASQAPPEWLEPGVIRVVLGGLTQVTDLSLRINRKVLLVILRNLIANIRDHGQGADIPEGPDGLLEVRRETDRLHLLVRNRVPSERLPWLQELSSRSHLSLLLKPFYRFQIEKTVIGGEQSATGLGLFTIAEIARLSDGTVEVGIPRLARHAEGWFDFVVEVSFAMVSAGARPDGV